MFTLVSVASVFIQVNSLNKPVYIEMYESNAIKLPKYCPNGRVEFLIIKPIISIIVINIMIISTLTSFTTAIRLDL